MNFRKLLVKLHLYVGLTVGAILAVSGVTGSLLIFGRNLDKNVNAHLTTVAVQTEKVSFDEIEKTLETEFPNSRISYVKMPRTADQSIEFHLLDADSLPIVYINPYTGEILGVRDEKSVFVEWIFALHTGRVGGDIGETIIGAAAFVLLFLSLSGVYLWFPGRKNIKRGFLINTKNGAKRTIYDIHNVIGFYACVLLVITSLSGIYLVFHEKTGELLNVLTNSAPQPAPPKVEKATDSPRISFDEALAQASLALPNAEWTYILPPTKPAASLSLRGKLADEWHPNGRCAVYLNPATGEVLRVENALNAPLGTRIANALYPIHIGIVGGTANRVVQFFLGLVPLLLYVTGFLMWNTRRKKRLAAAEAKAKIYRKNYSTI